VIAAQALAKRFGAVPAVRDVSFRAPDGAITGLLGPNGAGKTTTLRMIATLVAPTRGTVVGTLFGALLLAVLNNGLALEAAGAFAQQTLLGTVTILAVVLDRYTNRRTGKPA
jgi:ABC-type uncharacterized transport system ATPase subunit